MCWNPKVKYTSIFWALVISIMLCIAGLLYAGGAFAGEKSVTMHCKARNVEFITTQSDYTFGVVDFERGNFRALPSEDQHSLFMYNLDSRKVLVVTGRDVGTMYVAVYKSVDDYHAKKPEYQDNCHF